MSRVERKKNLEPNSNKLGRKTLCVMLVLLIMVVGIIKVDDSFRNMMLLEGPRVLQYEKLNQDTHQIYFCGESFYVDEKKIRETVGYVKKEIDVFLDIIKNQKDQLVKYDG